MSSCTKRILSVLLVAVMMLSLLAGCGEKKDDTTDPGTTNEDVTPGTSGEGEGEGEGEPAKPEVIDPDHPNWLCKEKTTLTAISYDAVNNSFNPTDMDTYWEWVEEQTNVHIDWEIIPYAGYNEVIQARMAAGVDLPDIIQVYSLENAQGAGENGILLDMAPYWDTHFTNTKAYFEKRGVNYKSLVENGTGAIYALTATQEPVENHTVFMYNAEWMKKLNLEIPTTFDEFNHVLETMKAAGDINGNGKDDEVILTSASLLRLNAIMGNTFGLENYYYWNAFQADENGKVWHEDTSDNMKALLKWENEMYEKGILDREINSLTATLMSEKIAADRVGIFVYYSSFAMAYGRLCSAGQEDPLGEHYIMGGPLASEWNDNQGYYVKWEKAASNPTAVNADSENAELAMRWLDFMFCNEEANIYRTLGELGKHYELDENGEAVPIQPEDGSRWQPGSNNSGQLTLAYNQTKEQLLITKYEYKWYGERYAWIRENVEFRSPSVPVVNYYTEDEQFIIDTYKADFDAYRAEMHAKFVNGTADIDKDWDTFVKNMEKLGLKEITQVHQNVYDRANKG